MILCSSVKFIVNIVEILAITSAYVVIGVHKSAL